MLMRPFFVCSNSLKGIALVEMYVADGIINLVEIFLVLVRYHTGDLGTMDGDGNVFIKGRSKNMLLGANGQNIYPEEIEDKLNTDKLC